MFQKQRLADLELDDNSRWLFSLRWRAIFHDELRRCCHPHRRLDLEHLPQVSNIKPVGHVMNNSVIGGVGLLSDQKSIVCDLVCSLLAVNLWTVEKTFNLSQNLERECLFDMDAVTRMSRQEVIERLIRARYSRGDYITGLLADRLLSVAAALSGEGLSRLCTMIAEGEIGEMDTWLLSLKGIGPQVLKNFKMLQGLDSDILIS